MICFPHHLPCVIWKNQRLVPLSEGWLTESIEESARRAGMERWELAPHVARAITQYLETECRATAVTVETLEKMIRRSLEGIGFNEVAEKSRVAPPRVSIFLPELASVAACELLFFPMLRGKLSDAVEYEVRGVRLIGLRDCVKILDSAPRWRRTCSHLSHEIVSFSRQCLTSRPAPASLELVIDP